MGKVGLALLNEGEDKLSRLILYQNKQKPLASARITLEFILAVSTFLLSLVDTFL